MQGHDEADRGAITVAPASVACLDHAAQSEWGCVSMQQVTELQWLSKHLRVLLCSHCSPQLS